MHRHRLVVAGLLLAVGSAWALDINKLRLNTDVDASARGSRFNRHEILSMGYEAFGSLWNPCTSGLPDAVELDAVAVYSNLILFSTDISCTLDAVNYTDHDVIAWNANTDAFSMWFDGTAAGLPDSADIDAIAVPENQSFLLYFSLKTEADLPGVGVVSDEDIVQAVTGRLHQVWHTADFGVPPVADLDALFVTDAGVFFSLDITVEIDGQIAADQDVWYYDYAASNIVDMAPVDVEDRADLVSLDDSEDYDGDWLADFEEHSGRDDPATTYPGLAAELDPDGYTSDPRQADTDEDTLHDGEETACGTNPDDDTDYLHILSTHTLSGNRQSIVWSSVDGHQYALMSSPYMDAPFTNEVATPIWASGGSDRTGWTNTTAQSPIFYRIELIP